MKKIISIILIWLMPALQSFIQQGKYDARQNIRMLKQGALFIRLQTSILKIDGLKQRGRNKEAEKIRVEQEEENKSIAASFHCCFDFCKVYFFYSTFSAEVKNGNYKPYLMDWNFQNDSTFNGNNYLIGEFDESATTNIDAFIIKDKNYVQLNSPFPFLTRRNAMLISTRSKDEVVRKMNLQLNDYWAKNN